VTPLPRLVTIGSLECRLVDFDWEFAHDRGGAVADHWLRRRAANSALYDGIVLLANRVEACGESLEVDFFETRFSRFLAWRDFDFPDRAIHNCFAMPALRSSDGAILVGEMGPDHSLAGQLFFPGGTPDLKDIKQEKVDLVGSLVRELAEETGLNVAAGDLPSGWRVVLEGQRVACLKIIDWPAPASEIMEAVAEYIARDPNPELSRAHMIRRCADIEDSRMPAFVRFFLQQTLLDL
jgi:8-oxo-dGTP pyrophosphatase MutT (NUDIX family)